MRPWLALVVLMLTADAYRHRQIMRDVLEDVEGADRHVDAGVTLHVVASDPNGKELLPGCPPMRILRTSRHGGMIDTKSNPPALGPGSTYERTWYCSEDQAAALFAPSSAPPAQLVQGSEGAGKSRLLVYFHYFRWLEFLGQFREGGQTAPTLERLGAVKGEMVACFGHNWCRWVERDDFTGFVFCDGTRIRFRYTHKQSEAKGSPIQSYNWSWAGRDEAQDSVEAHADIQARGRTAPRGRYQQLATATAKDSPDWRTLRDTLEASGLWARRTLLGPSSPFVWAAHWEAMRKTMPDREYRRRVLAQDVVPEKATYPDWSRNENLIEVPPVGSMRWVDVTDRELRASGANLKMLVGHDPGNTIDVSLFARAYTVSAFDPRRPYLGSFARYERGEARPFWVVHAELNTEQSTTENHIVELLKLVQERWSLNLLSRDDRDGRYRHNPNGNQILVRADPAGNTDNRTDKSVYTQFANAGIKIKPAAYNADNDGHGRVPREAGVELVNTLICNAAGERRLFVERLPDGRPAAPKLVAALESSERDDSGRAEVMRKGKGDTTHWPAALRYMLWAIERPRLQLVGRREA